MEPTLILETEAQKRLVLPVQAKPDLKPRSYDPNARLAVGIRSASLFHLGTVRNVAHTVVGHWEAPKLPWGGSPQVSSATQALGCEPLACSLSPLCGMWQPPAPL